MTIPKITPELLADLRKKAEAATPGEWYASNGYEQGDPGDYVAQMNGLIIVAPEELLPRESDAEFIAAVNPQIVLALLTEIERLQKCDYCGREKFTHCGICDNDE